jgi:hypothetical protein
MSTFKDLEENPNYKQLIDQLSDKDKKEIEDSLVALLEKFDISLGNFLDTIEKRRDG